MSICPRTTGKHAFERKEDTANGDWMFMCSFCGMQTMIETVHVMTDKAGNPEIIFEQGKWHPLQRRKEQW